jgi:PIN domain nuclease of toxin-antitoxin system
MKIQELPVSWEHASSVRNLPAIHRDPFDRILVAQALAEPMRLLTSDELLRQYSELVIAIN